MNTLLFTPTQGLGDQDVDLWTLALLERSLPGEAFSESVFAQFSRKICTN